MQNCLARVVLRAPRFSPSLPLLKQLHWLPVNYRIKFKLSTLTYHALAIHQPPYLASLLHFSKAGHRSTLRSSVFAFWHRASVYVRLSAFCLRICTTTKVRPVCVDLRLREQCLRSEITSVARVAHVLLLRLVAGNVDVNTPASKRSQLIGNTAIVRKRCVIHKSRPVCACVFQLQRLRGNAGTAAFYSQN